MMRVSLVPPLHTNLAELAHVSLSALLTEALYLPFFHSGSARRRKYESKRLTCWILTCHISKLLLKIELSLGTQECLVKF